MRAELNDLVGSDGHEPLFRAEKIWHRAGFLFNLGGTAGEKYSCPFNKQ